MNASDIKNLVVENFSLLNHEFYVSWNKGLLKKETMQDYAKQYFHHEANFPIYLTTMHSRCESPETRQIILENLIDEEKGLDSNHLELWVRFGEGLGLQRVDIQKSEMNENTKSVVQKFKELCAKSTACGIGSMFAYETQVPEVYKTKIDGLDQRYSLNDDRSIEFFKVHLEMDKWHSKQWEDVIDKMTDSEKEEAKLGAVEGARAMLHFLDGFKLSESERCDCE